MDKMIQAVVYALTLYILSGIIDHLYTRDDKAADTGQNDEHYELRVPKIMRQLGLFIFAFCNALAAMFLLFRLSGVQSATVGHVVVFLVFASLGLWIVIWTDAWRMKVQGENIEIRRLLRRTQRLTFSEITRVKLTKKYQLVLYKGKKKLAVIDVLMENRSCLEANLKQYGKLPE